MKKRLDSLQALKALACLLVFANHSGIKCAGTGAICTFFLVSGFTMVYSYHDRIGQIPSGFSGCIRFAVQRVKKLYPLYLLCMLPVMLLDLTTLLHDGTMTSVTLFLKKLVLSLFLLQSWVPDPDYALAFNGVAWFLSTALFLYFSFPFILRCVQKLTSPCSASAFIALLLLLQFILGFAAEPLSLLLIQWGLPLSAGRFQYWFTYIFPPFRLIDFAVGCLLGKLYLSGKLRPKALLSSLLLDASVVLLWLGTAAVYWNCDCFITRESFIYTQLFMPASFVTVCAFIINSGPLVHLLNNRFTRFIARINSDFFLLHQNIIRFFVLFLSMLSVPFSIVKPITPPFCFCLTVFACLIWEKLQNYRKRISSKP